MGPGRSYTGEAHCQECFGSATPWLIIQQRRRLLAFSYETRVTLFSAYGRAGERSAAAQCELAALPQQRRRVCVSHACLHPDEPRDRELDHAALEARQAPFASRSALASTLTRYPPEH